MTINHIYVIITVGVIIAVVTNIPAPVYAQTTGVTPEWCEKKTNELKDRLTDLMLSGFAKNATVSTSIEIRDNGNVLVTETEQQIIDCADHLTDIEMQTLEQMHEASIFFACLNTSLDADLIDLGVPNATNNENESFAERNILSNATSDPYSMLTTCIASYSR